MTKTPNSITRYLSVEKAHPRELGTIAELFARAAFESAGYEVLHRTIPGAAAFPASAGKDLNDLYYVKVTFERVEDGK